MIPNKSGTTVSGSIPGKSTKMVFDERATQHIISILTDMYSDPELAVLRELSTNARDSMIQSGRADVPINVSTPGPLSPYLVVSDTGLGLSVDELHNLYSKYGASTKRGSNEATGMLGIGSKSPLTYTSQFTLVSIHDGTKATVSISRDEDGVGNLTVVDTSSTTEPNGVTIKVPAKSRNEIQAKAKKFFSYWAAGTILLDGKEPSSVAGMEVCEGIVLCKGDRYSRDEHRVVMGNVPYPVGSEFATTLDLPYGYFLVATVPIGALDFAPSREALQFTSRTKRALADVAETFRRELPLSVQRAVQDAPTMFEAIKVINSFAKVLGGHAPAAFQYRGHVLPTAIRPPTRTHKTIGHDGRPRDENIVAGRILTCDVYARNYKQSSSLPAVDLEYVTDSIFIANYAEPNFTATHKKKLLQWLSKQPAQITRATPPATAYMAATDNLPPIQALTVTEDNPVKTARRFILVDFSIPTELIHPALIVDWSTVAAEKLPSSRSGAKGASGRIVGSYDLYLGGSNSAPGGQRRVFGVPGANIDRTKPVFYVHGNWHKAARLGPIMDPYHPAYTVICLPANRLDKFKRENTAIGEAQAEVQRLYDVMQKGLSPAQKTAIWMYDHGQIGTYRTFRPHVDRIDDPEIKALCQVATADIDTFLKSRRHFQSALPWVSDSATPDPLEKYRLWDAYEFRQDSEQMIRYLNNEYAFQASQA